MLRPTTVTYDDIVSFLAQGDERKPASVLRTLFDGAHSEALIARWLADESKDGTIHAKDAAPELLKLIETRLGLILPDGTSISAAREKTVRYALVGEFRSDLMDEPPASVGMVPPPLGKEQIDRVREISEILRKAHAEQYVELANRVASDLNLEGAKVDAAHLGKHRDLPFRGETGARVRGRAHCFEQIQRRHRHRDREKPQLLGRVRRRSPGAMGDLPTDGRARPADRARAPNPHEGGSRASRVGRCLCKRRRVVSGRRAAAPPRDLGRQDGRGAGGREGPSGCPQGARGASQADG